MLGKPPEKSDCRNTDQVMTIASSNTVSITSFPCITLMYVSCYHMVLRTVNIAPPFAFSSFWQNRDPPMGNYSQSSIGITTLPYRALTEWFIDGEVLGRENSFAEFIRTPLLGGGRVSLKCCCQRFALVVQLQHLRCFRYIRRAAHEPFTCSILRMKDDQRLRLSRL